MSPTVWVKQQAQGRSRRRKAKHAQSSNKEHRQSKATIWATQKEPTGRRRPQPVRIATSGQPLFKKQEGTHPSAIRPSRAQAAPATPDEKLKRTKASRAKKGTAFKPLGISRGNSPTYPGRKQYLHVGLASQGDIEVTSLEQVTSIQGARG